MGLTNREDNLAGLSQGATYAVLEWTKDQIAQFVARLRNREIAFVRDPETVSLVREERKGPEWTLFKEHLHDKRLRLIFQMGLTLRRLEKSLEDRNKLLDLRGKILRKFGASGLRAAELVQRGVLGTFYMKFLREAESPVDIESALADLLDRVDLYTAFIQEKDNAREVVRELSIRVLSRVAQIFIVFGYGNAKSKAKEVVEELQKTLPKTYGAEKHETDRDFYALIGRVEQGEVLLVMPFSVK